MDSLLISKAEKGTRIDSSRSFFFHQTLVFSILSPGYKIITLGMFLTYILNFQIVDSVIIEF